MDELISLNGISKRYDNKLILNKVDLSIKENQSLALTGHNGSGKSTLLKIIAGLVNPSDGNLIYRRKLLFHYVPEHFPKMNLTVLQYLKRMCEIDGIDWDKERIESISEEFFLKDMMHIKMKYLSKGTLQKAGVIQALLTKPDVLLLDEPLSGQDIDSQRVFIKKMNQLRHENVTIIMSCHERYLIESISDTVYCIDRGKIYPVDIAERSVKEYILWFESSRNTGVPERYMDYVVLNGKECKAIVPEKLCNQVIIEMIQQGWILRRMIRAEDERIGEISSAAVF